MIIKKHIFFGTVAAQFDQYIHHYKDKADSLPSNTKTFNLCLIKKMGLKAWAKKKAKNVKDNYFYKKWEM